MCQNLWPDELKILVIDHEQEALNLIRLSLEPAGFRVLRTTDPEEGMYLALSEEPDLLILDIAIPVIDGYELLRRFRRHAKLAHVPAIVVSARAGTVDQRRILQLFQPAANTVDAYVGKPFDPAHLLQTVKNVLVTHKGYLLEKNRAGEQANGRQAVERAG